MIDATHDPALTTWVEVAAGHDFPVQNLPLGVFSTAGSTPRAGMAIGDHVVDLAALASTGLIDADLGPLVSAPTLNVLLADAEARQRVRAQVSTLLTEPAQQAAVEAHLYPAAAVVMHLPAAIGDYTDFYVGIHHATAIGKLMRPDNPLLPNYKYVPIGYHGRASTVRPSGTPVVRPNGQRKAPADAAPTVGPSRRLDFELEMAVWIGRGNGLGEPIAVGKRGKPYRRPRAAQRLVCTRPAGVGVRSARAVSRQELSDDRLAVDRDCRGAYAPFRIAQPPRPGGDPAPLPYLDDAADQAAGAFAIDLFVDLTTATMRATARPPVRLAASAAWHMYWTVAQMVAHHASNGCALNPGDLFGTGTLSGPDRTSCGSLMELSDNGTAPFTLPSGETRAFLEDGDEIIFSARAHADGFVAIGFGTCAGNGASGGLAAPHGDERGEREPQPAEQHRRPADRGDRADPAGSAERKRVERPGEDQAANQQPPRAAAHGRRFAPGEQGEDGDGVRQLELDAGLQEHFRQWIGDAVDRRRADGNRGDRAQRREARQIPRGRRAAQLLARSSSREMTTRMISLVPSRI